MEISFFNFFFFFFCGFVVEFPWPGSSTGLLAFCRGRSPARDWGWEGTKHTLQDSQLCFTPPTGEELSLPPAPCAVMLGPTSTLVNPCLPG